MSRTIQFVSIPLVAGRTSANITSTAHGVGGAEIKEGEIVFSAGPDLVGARYVSRNILVQNAQKKIPREYKDAGKILMKNRKMRVLVEFPD